MGLSQFFTVTVWAKYVEEQVTNLVDFRDSNKIIKRYSGIDEISGWKLKKTGRLVENSAQEARQESVDCYIKYSNSPSTGHSRQERLHPLYLTHRESGPVEMNAITLQSTLAARRSSQAAALLAAVVQVVVVVRY